MNTKWAQNKEIRILLSCSFLMVFGIFIAYPIIGLHALKAYGLNASEIGMLAGVWPATVFACTFFTGILVERWGYINSLRLGTILTGLAFAILAFASNVWLFASGLALCGIGKAFYDTSIRSLFTVYVDSEEREHLFRFRYMLSNAAVILGPLLGIIVYNWLGQGVFLTTTIIAVIVAFAIQNLQTAKRTESQPVLETKFVEKLRVLRDPRLARWIASGILISMAFSAFEALMPVISEQAHGARPSFPVIASLNAGVVVIAQLVHLRFFKNLDAWMVSLIGGLSMSLGYFTLANIGTPYFATLAGVTLLSVGEALLIPSFDIFMDRLAPDDQKAIYFGAGELRQVGQFFGPYFGGLLLQSSGVSVLFAIGGVWIVIALFVLKSAIQPISSSLSTTVSR